MIFMFRKYKKRIKSLMEFWKVIVNFYLKPFPMVFIKR